MSRQDSINQAEKGKLFALEELLNEVFGPDQIIIRSTKLEILDMIGSDDPEQRLSALEKVVFYDAGYTGSGTTEERMDALMAEYRTLSATLGSEVRVIGTDGEFTGRALDMDETGALIVALPDGERRRVMAGDVSVRGLMGYAG